MAHILVFMGMATVLLGALIGIKKLKNVEAKNIIGLFLFGVLLSSPFILVEYLAFNLKYYVIIMAFVCIEAGLILMEKKVKYFHDLIHHNIKTLRTISYLIVGIGFTFSETSFYIFHNPHTLELAKSLPLKMFFSVTMHTMFAAITGLASLGGVLANASRTLFKFLGYYLKIIMVSTSHYVYILLLEHKFTLLVIPFVAANIYIFFRSKRALDSRLMANA